MSILLLQGKSLLLPSWMGIIAICFSLIWISACSTTGKKTGYTSPKYDKARTLMENGQYKEAIPLLHAINESKPKLAEPYVNLGIALRKNEKFDDALIALETAVKLDSKAAATHHQLGILYREMGMFDESLAAYKKSLKLDHDYALAHRNIGILYDLYLQLPDQALNHYKKYLQLTSEPDKQVNNWIIDLERRTSSNRIKASQ